MHDPFLQRIEAHLGTPIVDVDRITTGMNNAVFVLRGENGQKWVAKRYFKDERMRLEREYEAFTFLRKEGFPVPEPLFRDDEAYVALYSYESGKRRDASNVSQREMASLADFLIRLNTYQHGQTPEFRTGFAFQPSTAAVMKNNAARVEKVSSFIASQELHPIALSFLKKTSMHDQIMPLTEALLQKSDVPAWDLAPTEQRLSSIDFGIHNALFENGRVSAVVDFEYFGWEDPLKTFGDFIAHDQTWGISDVVREEAVEYYADASKLSTDERKRLRVMIDVLEVKWLAIYLQSITPPVLKTRAFAAAGELDVDEYVEGQLQKAAKRYEEIRLRMLR